MVIPYGKPRSTGLQEGALSVERTLVWVLLITASLAQDPTIRSSLPGPGFPATVVRKYT